MTESKSEVTQGWGFFEGRMEKGRIGFKQGMRELLRSIEVLTLNNEFLVVKISDSLLGDMALVRDSFLFTFCVCVTLLQL